MNLSFAGCGFLCLYHIGVGICFKKYAPHLLKRISGASAGALIGCTLLSDIPPEEILRQMLDVIRKARQRVLGPFSPSFNIQQILLENLQKLLPEDVHIRVRGNLYISLTRVRDRRNVIVSQFSSKKDLIQAIMASSFVPFFSGLLPPKYHGVRYMDGGFSDNIPVLNKNTITVSPFCGESDICPRDNSSQLFHIHLCNMNVELSQQNICRIPWMLFAPKAEILLDMCKQGFDDALKFILRNDLIRCTRCLAVQSTNVDPETLAENMEYDPACSKCKQLRQEALVANLPETFLTILKNAINAENKGLINWLIKHCRIKWLLLLSFPFTLLADIIYVIVTKCKNFIIRSFSGDP